MKHQLPPLPFDKKALEPHISAETLEYHYGKHHRGYVDKLNGLIPGTPFETASLEEIVRRADGPIFNNGAQVWNHTFFWNCLSAHSTDPGDQLLASVRRDFGSIVLLMQEFKSAAAAQFGSGWAWLTLDSSGKLRIETTSNAENPIRRGRTPLLTYDVWEHAYYIDYRNDRARYLESMDQLLNWTFAEKNFDAAMRTLAA